MKRSRVLKKVYSNADVRRYRSVAAYAVFGLVIGALVTGLLMAVWEKPEPATDRTIEATSTSTKAESLSVEASLPVKIRVPSVGIEADFEEPLGVQDNYEVEVPESYETVGYYKYGPTPGEIGPAVVLGHVDSVEGPAVLYSLGQVEVGDEIEIEREDGSLVVFEVESLERHEQAGFPTSKVYGDIDHAGLRLITCSGNYDRGIQRYSHNLIVFARLATTTQASED